MVSSGGDRSYVEGTFFYSRRLLCMLSHRFWLLLACIAKEAKFGNFLVISFIT
jgi:hypothetical protein